MKNCQFASTGEDFCVLCAIRDHIELSLTSLGGIISPVKLVDNLNCILLYASFSTIFFSFKFLLISAFCISFDVMINC